jgi:hypothetical protein
MSRGGVNCVSIVTERDLAPDWVDKMAMRHKESFQQYNLQTTTNLAILFILGDKVDEGFTTPLVALLPDSWTSMCTI